jgi:hypothetical protein
MLLLRSDMMEKQGAKIRSDTMKIVHELGFPALAIQQAAAYIRVSLKDISKFMEIYSISIEKFLRKRPRQNWTYPYVVATTWSMLFERVKERKGAGGSAEDFGG